MAAVLACGEGAVLSHDSAAELGRSSGRIPAPSMCRCPSSSHPRRPAINVHRQTSITARSTGESPSPGWSPLSPTWLPGSPTAQLERAINEAVNRELTDPEWLRNKLPRGRPGVRRVARLLDRDTYVVTDSILEQRLLPIARRAGLPKPTTQRRLGGGRVDFVWLDIMLIVEADSLRFHRTPMQQRADRLRDQQHAAAGFTTLRFTHYQVLHEPEHVEATLRAVVRNLRAIAA